MAKGGEVPASIYWVYCIKRNFLIDRIDNYNGLTAQPVDEKNGVQHVEQLQLGTGTKEKDAEVALPAASGNVDAETAK